MKKSHELTTIAIILTIATLILTGCVPIPRNNGSSSTTAQPLPAADPYIPPASSSPEPVVEDSSPTVASSPEPAPVESTPEKTETNDIDLSDFSLVGTWKNTGNSGFGQAQPGAIVVFDGANCNFFSPRDTYAFYEDGGSYRLDTTSFLFAETLSFTVKIIDQDQIEVNTGSDPTILTRVG